jgi:putative ABC transport system ATP-binding protein
VSEPRIQASAVSKRFRRGGNVVPAIEDVDLTLAPGELVAVTGPSLSGKTTLVELLAGWRRPDSGAVTWDSGSTEPPSWSFLTVIPQAFAVLEELTVAENILLAHRVTRRQVAVADRLAELLIALGISHLRDRGAYEISVGERQRAMVARALVDQPDVILADEPVAHQDQHHAEIVLRLLREAVDAGASGIIATRQPEVADVADRRIALAPPS